MDSLQDLKIEIHKFEFTPDPKGTKAESLVKILDTALARDEDRLREQAPPLDLVVYSLKSILYPTFLPELMSEFLQLLTMVEFYRIRATEKASSAIEWNTFYQETQDEPIPLLTDDQEQYFRHIMDSQGQMRMIFMRIVKGCCFMDLARLWVAESNTDFWIRWNEYMDILRRPEDRKTPHSFHYNLSDDEIAALRDTCLHFSHFMTSTTQWSEEERGRGQSIQEFFKSKAFREQFPATQMTPKLEELIEYHFNYVLEAVQRLTSTDEEVRVV